MSRVGKLPVEIPEGVTLDVKNNVITANGPKGELSVTVDPSIEVKQEEGSIQVLRPSDEKKHRALHGLYRALIANIVHGVSQGYEKRLQLLGVGFRAEIQGKNLFLSIGYSHDTIFRPPDGIEFATEGNNIIIVRGADKQLVGQVAAKIRSLRPPEPYKGKGLRYVDEYVRKKAGKSA